MKKGFFFTTDALLATAVSVTLLVMAFGALKSAAVYAQTDARLARLGEDALTAMDKNGALAAAIAASTSAPIENALRALPPQVCATARIIRHGARTIISTNPGCQCTGRRAAAKRSIAVASGQSFTEYVASIEICTRQ